MRVRRIFEGLVLGFLLLACSSEQAPTAESESFVDSLLADVSEGQAEILADGIVTSTEYGTAFGNFETCVDLTGLGFVDIVVDPVSGVISYGSLHELSPPGFDPQNSTDECYQEFFSTVEYVFQTSDAGALSAVERDFLEYWDTYVRPCLEPRGVELPADPKNGDAEANERITEADILIAAGECDG